MEHDLALFAQTLSVTLLIIGIANCAGTFWAGVVLGRYFKATMYTIPFALAGTAALLFLFGQSFSGVVLTVPWGFIFCFIPVA